jgi:branched-chain amino acid transport system permease protein
MPLTSSRWRRWVPFLLLAVALVVFPLVASTSVVNVGVYALIFGIAAIGLSLLMGLAGQVSLGHAAFFAVGAYVQAILVTQAGWSMWPAAGASTVAAMVVALLVGLPLLRLRGHFLALATLCLGIIVAVVARELEVTGGTSGLYGIPKPDFGGRLYDSAQEYFWLLSPFVVVGMVLATNLVRSRAGRALGAVNDSEVAAECLGVDTFSLRLRVFVLAAGYAGLAGVFYAHWLAVVSPEAAGFELSVELLLMVVLGGLGTVWGAITGAVAVSAMDEGSRDLIASLIPDASGEVQLIAFGVVLVLVIILVPGGLAQLWNTVTAALSAHSPRGEATRAAPSSESVSKVEEVSPQPPPSVQEASAQPSALAGLLEGADLPERGGPLLAVRGLTKRYGGVVALDSLDLDVAAGEIVALIGPNGAGKTTAFNMVSGVLPPTSGLVTIRDQEVQGRRPHVAAALGATRTFQNLQVFGSTTVLGNVKVARHLRSSAGLLRGMAGLARAEERAIDDAARAALGALGLDEYADRLVGDLPFGLQRQVEIARALALGPALVLLDEPMAGLSGPERTSLSGLLREASTAGVAVLIVEHDVDAVLALADRVAVLDDGRLIAVGAPEDIRNDPAVIAAYLGIAEEDESLVRAAAARVEGEVGA